jgi:hypothetical protein
MDIPQIEVTVPESRPQVPSSRIIFSPLSLHHIESDIYLLIIVPVSLKRPMSDQILPVIRLTEMML